MYSLYILECKDKTLYTGITNDLPKRLKMHNTGKGAKYLRGRLPFKLVYTEKLPNKSSALKRELEVKKMKREEKSALINRRILIYAFSSQKHKNISSAILLRLKCKAKFLIDCSNSAIANNCINDLVKLINAKKFDYVIGLGSKQDKFDMLKIEAVAKNKFRNNIIVENAPTFYKISSFLVNKNISGTKINRGIGNSWCNLSAFKIANKTSALFAFIHIPGNFKKVKFFTSIVQQIISGLDKK